jgi:Spy/CpxP family protein refolding chaperone
MNRFRSLSIAAVVTALLAGGVVFAQGPGAGGRRGPGGFGGHGGPGGRGGGLPLRELNLNEAQQQQIRDITTQYRDQNRAAAEQLRTALDAQRKAVETLPVNEGLIRSTTQALVEAQTELAVQQARMQSDIFALLTSAQQEQVRKLQADREARRQQQGPRQNERQQRPGQQ